MQHPTLQRVRIRSTRDAHQIFGAVARNSLRLITRRLDAEERRAIAPGNVYVWEERASTSSETTGLGMERWTDGMGWGPSRVRDDFLFYHQKDWDVDDFPSWGDSMRRREQRFMMNPLRSFNHTPFGRPTTEAERLIKQTYSVTVNLPVDQARGYPRKWHLTAYFNQSELESLMTVDDFRGIGDVAVPEGWFKSARASKSKREPRDASSNARQSSVSPPPNLETSARSAGTRCSLPDQSEMENAGTPRSRHVRRTSLMHRDPGFGRSDQSCGHGSPVMDLVPLEYLKNVTIPRRNPTDEQVLSLFKDMPPHHRPHSHHAVSSDSCTCTRRFGDDIRSVS